MSDGSGRGGNTLKRSPPRKEEDRDATISHRSTRGTGLPPRILSSVRGTAGRGVGRGGTRGRDSRDYPVVRPQAGSVPPWAMRGRPAETYQRPNLGKGGAAGQRRFEKEPPTQPKWDREKSRTPLPSSRMMSSSPPSGSRNVGASLGYSSGPSHRRWMSPHDQAGPSRYSVHEPIEERGPAAPSAPSTPTTNGAHSQSDPTRQEVPADEMHRSFQLDIDTTDSQTPLQAPIPPATNHVDRRSMMQDEKEDIHGDSPGAGPSRMAELAEKAQTSAEKDIKPDMSSLMAEEIPTILDEDREDGVLAVKRHLVLQCYEKNPTVRSAARKAFRVQKTGELSAVGRIVQHILWRDDGVGVQWKKARNSKSPTKTTNTIAPSKAATVQPSPPKPPAAPPNRVVSTSIDRPKTPPLIVKPEPEPLGVTSTPMDNPKSRQPTPPIPTARAEAGPSKLSHVTAAATPSLQDSPKLTKKQKKQLRLESEVDTNKRKAGADSSVQSSIKPAKLPKTNHSGSSTNAAFRTREENRLKDLTRGEELAINGPPIKHGVPKKPKSSGAPPVTGDLPTKARKTKGERRRERLAAEQVESEGLKKNGSQDRPRDGVLTATNALPLGGSSSTHSETKDKGKGKAREIVDLSDDKLDSIQKAEEHKGASKVKPKEIVDLTKDSKVVNAKAGSSSISKPANSPTKNKHLPTKSSSRIPTEPLAMHAAANVPNSTSAPTSVRPPGPSAFPARPSAPPIRPSAPPASIVGLRPPTTHTLGLSTLPARPPAPVPLSMRPNPTNSSLARPPPLSITFRPPPSSSSRPPNPNTMPRPPAPDSTNRHPPPGHPSSSTTRPPPLSKPLSRPPPPISTAGTARPPQQPQYQSQAGQSSYSERQALAALARAPLPGQSVRPAITKFTPRPTGASGAIPARPPVGKPMAAPARPAATTTEPHLRPIHRNPTLSSSSPMSSGTNMINSRSVTPAVITPLYNELRRALSEKMEQMDNWTSMLVDLPDRADMTQRQIDRTRQECFDLQKQMREEKERTRSQAE